MEENKDIKEKKKDTVAPQEKPSSTDKKERPVKTPQRARRPDNKKGGGRRGFQGGRGGRRGRTERVKPEYDQKIVSIRRVTRVMAGGRRFSFSVALVAGNRKGKVGVGLGKATDTSLAIEKAFKNAKKNMVEIKRNKKNSISHEVEARYCTSQVYIKPSPGKGIVAGSSVRNVLDLAGITDVSSKILSRSKNKINIARATIVALSEFVD
ncbi:MAG: 30S ribosomal protein S5 [Candidatus Pacebacteria bacterium]|nr:30S ribosomal protein S5 [Candidatus Paceibacterota bacterium]